jgi:hypothetical protein
MYRPWRVLSFSQINRRVPSPQILSSFPRTRTRARLCRTRDLGGGRAGLLGGGVDSAEMRPFLLLTSVTNAQCPSFGPTFLSEQSGTDTAKPIRTKRVTIH